LGEITNNKKIITLRTSYIGRELLDKYGLLEWILQQKKIKGFKYAYFSGLTTLEFSRIIVDIVIPNKKMYGLYNVSAKKISKYNLIKMLIKNYNLKIDLSADTNYKIDRSLNSSKLKKFMFYKSPSWEKMILEMREFNSC
jgi:dTDP-4-dehydrorhamnose reductase